MRSYAIVLTPLIGLGLFQAHVVAAQAPNHREPVQRSPFEAVPEPPQSPSPKASGPTIEAIEFPGAKSVPEFALRAIIATRVGGTYDVETVRRDAQSLYNTQRFSDVAWESAPSLIGTIVRFVLIERPLIQSIEYQGAGTVTIPEILERFKQRKIKLRAETLFNEDELGRAIMAVQELVAEKGRRNITVTSLVEPIGSSSTVNITFRAAEKQ